jgi:hypothetical protein
MPIMLEHKPTPKFIVRGPLKHPVMVYLFLLENHGIQTLYFINEGVCKTKYGKNMLRAKFVASKTS